MKIVGIIFSLLLTLISGALFGGFSRGIFSVHNSFGRLMTDVVANVKQNIDCSIQSMQSILDKGKPTPYTSNSRCNGQANQRVTNTNSIKDVDTASSTSIKPNKVTNGRNFISTKQQSPNIDTSGSAANKTILNIINKEITQRKLDEINNVLKSESDQLNNVNVLLKQKMDSISKDVSEGLKKIEQDHKDPPIEKILHEIDLVREHKQDNSSKIDEVRQIAKDVLNILNNNYTTSEVSTSLDVDELMKIITDLERYSNNTLKDIGRQFKDWEIDESNQLYSIKNILERLQQNFSNEGQQEVKPLSFKGIAKNIFNGKSVYSNYTDSEVMIDNEAESLNNSKTAEYESIVMTTESVAEDNPVSLSIKHVDSNKDNVNMSMKSLSNISGILDHIPTTEKHVVTENFNLIPLINDTDNKSMPINISSNMGNVSDVSNGVNLATTESFLSTVQIYSNNTTDTTIEPGNTSTNKDSVLNDVPTMLSVKKYMTSENAFPTNKRNNNEVTNNGFEVIDTSTSKINIPNSVTIKNVQSTIFNNQINYIPTATELTYLSTTNTDYILVDKPAVSSVENRATTLYSYTDNNVKKIESTNSPINKNKTLDLSSEENLMTTKNLADTNYFKSNSDSIKGIEPIETSTNNDYVTNLPNNTYEPTESYILSKLNSNDNNETFSMYSSTITSVTPNLKSSEYSASTTQINTGNDIDNESESNGISKNINLSEILSTENSLTNEMFSNDRSHKEFIISSTNIDDLTDMSSVGSQTITDYLFASNQRNVDIETTTDLSILYTSINTDDSMVVTTDIPYVYKRLTIESPSSINKLNSNTVHVTTTNNILNIVTSEKSALSTQMNSNHDIEKTTENSAIISTSMENYSAQTIYSNDDVEENESVVTPTYYMGDTLNVSPGENFLATKTFVSTFHVDSYHNIIEATESIDTSTNIEISGLNLENLVTSEKPYDIDEISSNYKIYEDGKSISTSTTIDLLDMPNLEKNMPTENSSSKISSNSHIDQEIETFDHISDMSNEENLETSEYYFTTKQINDDLSTATENAYTSANTDNDLIDVSDVPNVDVLVTTEKYHAAHQVYSNEDTIEESKEILVTTKNLDSTYSYYNDIMDETDASDTSTDIDNIINVSNVEQFFTSKKLYDSGEIDSKDNIYKKIEAISTSTNINILDMPNFDKNEPTESSNTKFYTNNDIDKSSKSFDVTSIDKSHVKILETTEYYFTTNQNINADFNTPTENVYTSMNTGNVLVDALDMPSIEILATTDYYHFDDEIYSNEDTVEENAFIDISTRKGDTLEVSSEENLVTTENLISTNHAAFDDDNAQLIANEDDSIETQTNIDDTVDVPSLKEFVTSEKPLTINKILANVDKDIKSIDTNSDDLLDVLNEKKLVTSYRTSTKPIEFNINKHTESIDTSTQLYGAPMVERITTTRHSLSMEQITSNINTNTEPNDILSNTSDELNVSNLEKYLSVESDPFKQTTKQSNSFSSSPEDLKLLPKGKGRDQAVKLALNIFEQSKRSQMIMRNVFKNEKNAKDLF